ncbi:MAG: uL15 family ribosomal protein [Candidatus Diapherotrites archaeon]|nr:uL15 family ribosomal protein [Candidatus Diapherotrites archaeon]
MTVRKRKRKNKLRGSRTFGTGNTKHKRGSGCRGGKGRAGSHKHKYSKYYDTFGVTLRLKPRKLKGNEMNLWQVDENIEGWLSGKMIEKSGDAYVIDCKKLGIRKILSKGNLARKVILRNAQLSEKAREKIIASKGIIEEAGEKKEKGEK